MRFDNVVAFLEKLTGEIGIPGVDCTIHVGYDQVFRYCCGYQDLENCIPMQPHSLYYIYSATKVITCAAAAQLLERGKILLSEDVGKYLPAFKNMSYKQVDQNGIEVVKKSEKPLRILHLLNMTGGFSYNRKRPATLELLRNTNHQASTRQVVDTYAQYPLEFEPGLKWEYGLCHDVLAAVIEEVSGMKFGEYLKKNIFEPLNMVETGFIVPESKRHLFAKQYECIDENWPIKVKEVGQTNSFRVSEQYESGGAGLISSLEDYIKFAQAMANGGVGATGARILQAHTIDLMRTNCLTQEQIAESLDYAQYMGYGYGYGVRTMVNPARGGSLSSFGEFGWSGAAGAYVLIDPALKLSVFYAQHMLNNLEDYVHPRLRNLIYAAINA